MSREAVLDSTRCKAIVTKALESSRADEAQIYIDGGETTHLRFARNSPTTSGRFVHQGVTVRSTFGKRSGSATVNQLDPENLARAVRRSEELARLAPEDPEFMPALREQTYEKVEACFPEPDVAERMASGVAISIGQAARKDLIAAGFARHDANFTCLANTRGLFGYYRSTVASVSQTVRTPDGAGSGWASQGANRVSDLDFSGRSSVAIDKALRSTHPQSLDPGTYVTILEPACVASLVRLVLWAMNARRADEGRSYFSAKDGANRLGEKIFPETIHISSDPSSPLAPTVPWGGGGLPQRKRDWIRDGVVANLSYSRFWADKKGKEPVPGPANVLMRGQNGSVEDLVRSTRKGVLVTTLWYIRSVDPQTLLHTGLTRDGVFWIEDGKIAHPVTNFRWNDSPIAVLKGVQAMSRAVRVSPRGWGAPDVVVPALKVRAFTFSSVSDAV